MIRTYFDSTFHGSFGYAVITVDHDDRLLIINPAVVSDQPVWVQQYLSNQLLALADDLPSGRMAEVIDLVAARAVRERDAAHGCPKSTSPMIATDR